MKSSNPRTIEESRRRRDDRRRRLRRRRRALFAVVALVAAAGIAAAGWSGADNQGERPRTGPTQTSAQGGDGSPADQKPEPVPPPGRMTITAVGDVAMGRTPTLPPDRGANLFASVREHLRGDLVIGNLEQALTDARTSKCGKKSKSCFAFRTPPSYARNLKRAGFDMLNVANNHAYDFGAAGFADTTQALERAGLRLTGLPDQISYMKVGPARVAVIGFAPYATAPDLRDIDGAVGIVGEAASKADLVIVTMHAGSEGNDALHVEPGTETHLGEDRGDPVAFAHAVVDAGADLVLGHGPHVLRGMEWYRGRLIAYSLGNFAGHRNFNLAGASSLSGILRVTLRFDGSWVQGGLVPVRLAEPGTPVIDPSEKAHGLVRRLSRQDFGPNAVRMSFRGDLVPPGRPMSSVKAVTSPGPRGKLRVVGGQSGVAGSGPVRRFAVEVEGGLPVDPEVFAASVESTLFHRRSWAATGGFSLQRVSSEPYDFRVSLASPGLTDQLCLPLETGGIFSCAQGGRAIVNVIRWLEGAASYGDDLDAYRKYVVNHEVGHLLGRDHADCPEAGAKAPVMVQQTKGVAPCLPNPWPLSGE